jgi:uncharacterized protein
VPTNCWLRTASVSDRRPAPAAGGTTDADDKHHQACRAWFTATDRLKLVAPAPVIAEACYLIGRRLGASVEAAFLDDLARGAYGAVSAVLPEDLARMSHNFRNILCS